METEKENRMDSHASVPASDSLVSEIRKLNREMAEGMRTAPSVSGGSAHYDIGITPLIAEKDPDPVASYQDNKSRVRVVLEKVRESSESENMRLERALNSLQNSLSTNAGAERGPSLTRGIEHAVRSFGAIRLQHYQH